MYIFAFLCSANDAFFVCTLCLGYGCVHSRWQYQLEQCCCCQSLSSVMKCFYYTKTVTMSSGWAVHWFTVS